MSHMIIQGRERKRSVLGIEESLGMKPRRKDSFFFFLFTVMFLFFRHPGRHLRHERPSSGL